MAKQSNTKKKSLENHLDSDFDLDDFLDEQATPRNSSNLTDDQGLKEERSDLIKNSLLVVAVIATIFLWSFDWSPRNAYSYFFGNESSVYVFGEGTEQDILPTTPTNVAEAPRFPAFEPVAEPNEPFSATDYIVQLREKGLLGEGKLSAFDGRQLHSAGVNIEYVEALNKANLLGEFSFVDITEFHENRISIEYLTALERAGYLNDLSFVDITEFFENNVPIQYLNGLNDIGILNELSFVDITEFYTSQVSIDYLSALSQNDFIGELSFVDITEFYENGVTIEFLNDLKAKGLIDELSFVDIVDLYKAEGY